MSFLVIPNLLKFEKKNKLKKLDWAPLRGCGMGPWLNQHLISLFFIFRISNC